MSIFAKLVSAGIPHQGTHFTGASRVYLKELLDELTLSQYRLAKDIGVSVMRVNYVVNGKRPVTAELALRLGRYFGQSPRYWLNLQSRYDMDTAEDTLSDQVEKQVRPLAATVS